MTVDVHPGKAVDQRPAGDLDLLEVDRTELARRKRVRERALGQLDQLGIVAGDAAALSWSKNRRLEMISKWVGLRIAQRR